MRLAIVQLFYLAGQSAVVAPLDVLPKVAIRSYERPFCALCSWPPYAVIRHHYGVIYSNIRLGL